MEAFKSWIDQVAVVIITKNAAVTLKKTLVALKDFPEVVIYDNGSTDETEVIAKSFSNVRFFQGAFLGFGPTKNYAVSFAERDWILSLDADEAPTPSLIEELAAFRPFSPLQVGRLTRENFFFGKKLSRGGWGDDHLVRLFNRTKHAFSDSQVHESIVTHPDTLMVYLKSAIWHNAVYDLSQILQKIDRYSDLHAKSSTKTYPVLIIVLKAIFAFLQSYIFKLGFLEGWRGLLVAVSNSNSVFFKYFKTWVRKNVSVDADREAL
jgi:glycosyltransferase involved in cell wall biosynthesis